VSPAKVRMEVRRVNDELARRPEGKSWIVGCTLDEVSNMCSLCKALTGDARQLPEHLRLAIRHATHYPMAKATSILESSLRRL